MTRIYNGCTVHDNIKVKVFKNKIEIICSNCGEKVPPKSDVVKVGVSVMHVECGVDLSIVITEEIKLAREKAIKLHIAMTKVKDRIDKSGEDSNKILQLAIELQEKISDIISKRGNMSAKMMFFKARQLLGVKTDIELSAIIKEYYETPELDKLDFWVRFILKRNRIKSKETIKDKKDD